MAFKAAGNPISVLRENLLVNGASFTGTGTNPTAMSDSYPGRSDRLVVPENGTFLHVNANTAAGGAVVSPNPGAILKAVVLNTAGAAGNVLTVYDGSSTTVPPARII